MHILHHIIGNLMSWLNYLLICHLQQIHTKTATSLIYTETIYELLRDFSYLCGCLLTIFKINLFKKKSLTGTIRVSNHFDLDQDQRSVGPDLGPNCLQRSSADVKSPLARKVNMSKFLELILTCRSE